MRQTPKSCLEKQSLYQAYQSDDSTRIEKKNWFSSNSTKQNQSREGKRFTDPRKESKSG